MKKAKAILKNLNLRPTSQRLAITETLIKKRELHVTAYSLEKMLVKSKVFISRATIYNNLNELSSKGFLKKVIVKNGVFIGPNSTIMPGVTIEKNTFIKAGSVITKSTRENSIVFGNPQKEKNLLSNKLMSKINYQNRNSNF